MKIQPVRDLKDKESTNLYVGKILDDNMFKCQIINMSNDIIDIKVLDIYWDRIGTYIDVGKTYPVVKRPFLVKDSIMQVWEIDEKYMKRNTSQVIFQWEIGIGWCWDLYS